MRAPVTATVTQRKDRGTYVVWIRVAGLTKPITRTCQTKVEAEALKREVIRLGFDKGADAIRQSLEAAQAKRENAAPPVEYPRLKVAVRWFLRRQVKRGDIRPSTASNYRNALRNWVSRVDIDGNGRVLGDLRVDKVTRKDIGALIGKIKEAGRSMAVVDQVRYPISQLYTYFREEEVWPGELANPAADVRYFVGRTMQRKAKKRDIDWVPVEQGLHIIRECVDNPRFQRRGAMVVTAFLTGMRWGELVALERTDLEPSMQRINVQRTWSEGSGRVDDLKDSERRYVPLSPFLAQLLRRHIERMDVEAEANRWNRPKLVFVNKAGNMDTSSGALYDHCWTPLLDYLGVPKRKFHATRHSFATWAIIDGKPLTTVQGWMGHATLNQLSAYVHAARQGGELELGGKLRELMEAPKALTD